MPLVPALPPQPAPIRSGFDYVTVDAAHRNVIAAHGGAASLLIVDADTGKVKASVRVGQNRGVAYDPATGHAFTGTADGKIVEVDPDKGTIVRSVTVPGEVDAIAYDAATARLYADEDDGTKLWVIDAKTFTLKATVTLPGHKPEYLQVDPATHVVYQNIANLSEIVVVDPKADVVRNTITTPELTSNHPLQFDPGLNQLAAAGVNGVMSAYDPSGKKFGSVEVPKGIDQCDLDPGTHVLACAHGNGVTLVQLTKDSAPKVIDETPVPAGTHTVAIDAKTHDVWIVWARPDGTGDFYQRLTRPTAP